MTEGPEEIRFKCPRCESWIQAIPALVGLRMDCPKCQRLVVVPADGESVGKLFDDVFDQINSNPDSQDQDSDVDPNPQSAENPRTESEPATRESETNESPGVASSFELDDIDSLIKAEKENVEVVDVFHEPDEKSPDTKKKTKAKPKPKSGSKTTKNSRLQPLEPSPKPSENLDQIPDGFDLLDSADLEESDVDLAPLDTTGLSPELPSVEPVAEELLLEPLDDAKYHPEPIRAPGFHVDDDEDMSPLKVEGITDEDIDLGSVIGIVCKICDTRSHVPKEKTGQNVECPICFSKVAVRTTQKIMESDSASPNDQTSDAIALDDAEELRLAAPVELEPLEEAPTIDNPTATVTTPLESDHLPKDSEIGLPEVEDDLLKPKPIPVPVESESESDESSTFVDTQDEATEESTPLELQQPWEDVFDDSPMKTGTTDPEQPAVNDSSELSLEPLDDDIPDLQIVPPEPNTKKGELELDLDGIQLEDPSHQPDGVDQVANHPAARISPDYIPPTPEELAESRRQKAAEEKRIAEEKAESRRKRFEQSQEQLSDDERETVPLDEEDLAPYEMYQFVERTLEVTKNTGFLIRAGLAALCLGIGNSIWIAINLMVDDTWSGAAKTGMNILQTLGMGLFWGIGWAILFYVCGVIFRETASGKRSIKDWNSSGIQELRDTGLIFAISFIVAGLPMAILGITGFTTVISNMICQLFIAPPLLLAAWFNQSPIQLLAPAAFKNLRRDATDWSMFYLFIALLAFAAVIAGGLYYVPFYIPVSFIASTMHVCIMAFFATSVGWHSARVIAKLDVHDPE